MFINPLAAIDSYKLGHADQYPKGTQFVYSNFTARYMTYLNLPEEYKKENKFVFFGAQALIAEMTQIWELGFFSRSKEKVMKEFGELVRPFVGPSGFAIKRIGELWDHGCLPIEVRALPEGSRVDIGVACLLIFNTDEKFYWITNYLEDWISCELWKSCNSATMADCMKQILISAAKETGAPEAFVPWQGHDFSMRGMSGIVDASKSGAGHLVSFLGTDCVSAVSFINQYYDGNRTFVGGSVPATEHSVMCAGGEESELETFRRLITEVYPDGVVSIVSDTWDFWQVLTEYAPALKNEILARGPDDTGLSKVVFRPDSGDPVEILCGVEGMTGPGRTAAEKGAVEVLWDIFGGNATDLGYKVLNEKVGLIYGDSITPWRAKEIMRRLKDKGFASNNTVLGVGSFTYQYNTRDSLGFAMKATYVVVNGVGRAIFKNPKTDNGTKRSAKGLIKVVKEGDKFVQLDQQEGNIRSDSGELRTIFRDGEWFERTDFATIRQTLADSRK